MKLKDSTPEALAGIFGFLPSSTWEFNHKKQPRVDEQFPPGWENHIDPEEQVPSGFFICPNPHI